MDVATLAGSTQGHQDGQGAAGGAAQFNDPVGVAARPGGGAYVSDRIGHTIRSVSAGGAVATFAGSGTAGRQDGQGTAARFKHPCQIARDADGNQYVADAGNNLIRKVTPSGLVSTFAGTGEPGDKDGHCSEATFNYPSGVAVSPTTGSIIVADQDNHRIRIISVRDNFVNTLAGSTQEFADGVGPAARFSDPFHVACDEAGDVYVTDLTNHRVRKITVADRAVTTLAGDGTKGHRDGAGAQARFNCPYGVAVDGGGNVLVTDYSGHRVRMVTPAGATSTLAGDGTQGSVDGQGAAARFKHPRGLAVDAAGHLLVADGANHRVRRVAAGLAPPASLRAPEPDTPAPLAALATNYAKLLDEGEDTYHDVEFLVGGETVRAHKAILSSQCEYFATMLGSGFAEGTGGGGATSSTSPAPPQPVADTPSGRCCGSCTRARSSSRTRRCWTSPASASATSSQSCRTCAPSTAPPTSPSPTPCPGSSPRTRTWSRAYGPRSSRTSRATCPRSRPPRPTPWASSKPTARS